MDTAARLFPSSDAYPYGLASSLIAVVAAGFLLANRSTRPMRDAALLAGALVTIGLVSLPTLPMGAAEDSRNLATAVAQFAQPVLLVCATWLLQRRSEAATAL